MTMIPDRDREVDAERIREFLRDELIQGAFRQLETAALRAFKTAKTDDERRDAQALAKATDALAVEMVRIVDAGGYARNEREQRDRALDAR